jgi:hypothetical protein
VDIAIMSAQRNKTQRLLQPAAIAIPYMGNCRTQKVAEAAIIQNTGIRAQKGPAGDSTEFSREDVSLGINNTRSIIRCCSSQLRSAESAATIITKTTKVFGEKYALGHQSDLRSVSATNATADVFLAFTVVQWTATEKEKFAVITKAVSRLLKNNANSSL